MSDDARQDHKSPRGPDHDVGVSSTIDKYEAFLQRLAYDNGFRTALAANPVAILAREGIVVPNGKAPRLKKVVQCLGLPPVDVVKAHIQDLEALKTREKSCDESQLAPLLEGLADPASGLRERLTREPRETLAEFGIDFDELGFEEGEQIELPPAEELAELIQQNRAAGIRLVNRIRKYHFQLEWYLLTTGGRSY